MFTQYINHFINNFDQKKTMDQLQKVATSKEGAIGIATALVLMAGVSAYNNKKFDRGCPRVPDSSLIYGSTDEYRKDPIAFINKWQKKLGDVYSAFLFGQEVVVVSGSQVREVFLNDRLSFLNGINKFFDILLLTNSAYKNPDGTSPVVPFTVKVLNPSLKHFTPRVIEYLTLGFNEFSGDIPAEGKDFYHVYPMVQHMVAKASAAVFVGINLTQNEQLIDSFKNMVLEVGAELSPKPFFELFPTLNRFRMWFTGKTSASVKRHRKQLYDALKPEIQSRLEAQKREGSNWQRPDDILQSMIETDLRPSYLDVYDYCLEMVTQFIFAALHTTSENSTVVLYRIMSHPGLLEELYKEQNEVLEKEGFDNSSGPEVFTRDVLNKFVKLDSTIREAFRIKNVYIELPHINMSNSNVVLSGGAVIRPGESVYPNVYANHNDPQIQKTMEDLTEFKPLRFVGAEKNTAKIGEDYLFFGLGKHACPGRWFAIQEIKTIIAFMIRKFDIVPLEPIVIPTDAGVPFGNGMYKLIPRK
ncbi:unnamed protein product [Cunninghamella blakesleeana]